MRRRRTGPVPPLPTVIVVRWTPAISVSAGIGLACEDYEYLAEFRCTSLDCTSIKLACVPIPSHCIFLQYASVDSSSFLTAEWLSQDGYVLHGIQCLSDNCGSFSIGIRQLSSTLPWTPSFSEENEDGNEGASSLNAIVPIVGLSCSGDHCDEKKVLYLPTSACVGDPGDVRWTDYFSSLDNSYTSCADYEYVARIQCQGDYCETMRLGCVHMASHCSFTTGLAFMDIGASGSSWRSEQGYVLWSIQCKNDRCGTLSLGFRQLLSTVPVQWSPSFSEEDVDGDASPSEEDVDGDEGGSPNNNAPIAGLLCSGEDCADKKVVQTTTSSCIVSGAAVRWTQYFTSLDDISTSCEDYEYVARIG
ncbi:hypothetical protein DIPPA_14378 [Diplonema papillatum]|nr:hypothetical protein DIPPA_14378 [Diplonema papillatum]